MCHQHQHQHQHQHELPDGHPGGVTGNEVARCPVMPGNQVIKTDAEAKGLHRDYEGQRYWLCCAACGPAFDADPAKYTAA